MNVTSRIHRIIYVFTIGLMCLCGCTSLRNEVDPSLLGVTPAKLVISGFLSPQDTILAVKVTRSATVVGDSLSLLQTGNNVTDATVTLTDGSKSVRLLYNNIASGDTVRSRPYYSINARSLPILAGHTYTLTVQTANGQQATSACTIPAPVSPATIKFDSVQETQGRSQSRRYYVITNWQDPVGQINYYQVAGYFRYTTRCTTCQTDRDQASGTFPLTFDDDNRGLISDVGLDGTLIPSGRAFMTSATLPNNNQGTGFYSQFRTASVTVDLMSVEQSYYQFQQAVIRQRRVRNNPFAEPVLIPSNIQGGLGCFAGYNNATMTLKLK